MKVLVTGKGGQLAWELEQTCPSQMELHSLGIEQLDITDRSAVFDCIGDIKPDVVINAAAYTAVDKAETDQEAAYSVNADASEYLAQACKANSAKLMHISTDFVFDGQKTTPYLPSDIPHPLNVYGASKLAGEEHVAGILGSDATIIRTAWVYSANGNNFVKTMLRLMSERKQLGIVYDQVGTPTWAKGLAQMIWQLVVNAPIPEGNEASILHWTDAGVASWYDFAVAIQELGVEKGLLARPIELRPIAASAYPTPAARPSFSVIDKTSAETKSGLRTTHWRAQLSQMMDELQTITK
uniref:dTDP-4-dehydrorhamnose reductase n=1 Tax=Thaumasiovibrio occultus TaxID=1891184 RepID=UPI000B355AC1|nr:dTDP-4-dehydrorhamnose reductase [Thaumasiovibrio occultus]